MALNYVRYPLRRMDHSGTWAPQPTFALGHFLLFILVGFYVPHTPLPAFYVLIPWRLGRHDNLCRLGCACVLRPSRRCLLDPFFAGVFPCGQASAFCAESAGIASSRFLLPLVSGP